MIRSRWSSPRLDGYPDSPLPKRSSSSERFSNCAYSFLTSAICEGLRWSRTAMTFSASTFLAQRFPDARRGRLETSNDVTPSSSLSAAGFAFSFSCSSSSSDAGIWDGLMSFWSMARIRSSVIELGLKASSWPSATTASRDRLRCARLTIPAIARFPTTA